MSALPKSRDVRLLVAALGLSMLGDSALLVVLGVAVKDLTGSYGAAGLTYLGVVAPAMLAPIGGAYMDRVRRKPFLIWVCLLSAAGVLPLVGVSTRDEVWVVYAVAVGYGLSFFLISAAVSGLLQVTLTPGELATANSTLQVLRQGLRLAAPLVGTALYAWQGLGAVAILDAATFVVAACVCGMMKVRELKPDRTIEGPYMSRLTAGGMFLLREPTLRSITFSVSGSLLFIGFATSTIYAVVQEGLSRPTSFIGVLVATQGIGAIAGGLCAPRVIKRLGDRRSVGGGLVLFGVGQGALATSTLPLVLIGTLVAYSGLMWVFIAGATSLQRLTPGDLIGRTSTAQDLANALPQAVSIAVGALLVSFVDYRLLQVVLMLGVVGCGVLNLRVPGAPEPQSGTARESSVSPP